MNRFLEHALAKQFLVAREAVELLAQTVS